MQYCLLASMLWMTHALITTTSSTRQRSILPTTIPSETRLRSTPAKPSSSAIFPYWRTTRTPSFTAKTTNTRARNSFYSTTWGWRGVSAQSSSTQLSARVGQKDEEATASSGMMDIVSSSKKNTINNDDTEMAFNIQTALALVGGQSVLIVAAVALAYLAQTPALGLGTGFVIRTLQSWQTGLCATLPLGLLAVVLDRFEARVPALQKVTQATQRSVLTLLGSRFLPLTGLVVSAALGIAAGVGEEWLVRGVLQTELTNLLANTVPSSTSINPSSIAVVLSSILFGALHAVTPIYAFLATLASLYFGWLYVWSDNLAISMICHGLYDIGALYYAHWTVAKDLTPQERQELLRLPF